MMFQGVMEEGMGMLQVEEAAATVLFRQHKGQNIIDDTSTVIVKRVISGCSITTSMMIAYTPMLLSSEVSYVDDSFRKYSA
jgi:hypothetical protein